MGSRIVHATTGHAGDHGGVRVPGRLRGHRAVAPRMVRTAVRRADQLAPAAVRCRTRPVAPDGVGSIPRRGWLTCICPGTSDTLRCAVSISSPCRSHCRPRRCAVWCWLAAATHGRWPRRDPAGWLRSARFDLDDRRRDLSCAWFVGAHRSRRSSAAKRRCRKPALKVSPYPSARSTPMWNDHTSATNSLAAIRAATGPGADPVDHRTACRRRPSPSIAARPGPRDR